jgi:hypothetical protein
LVAGLRRDQIVMLDLAASPVAVTGWATTRYQQHCAAVFATYMRDVDVSPDDSYFVVVTTGAYRAGSLCDAAARWKTAATGPGQQPTWVDYTGGDTLYSVAVTGTAVYLGGDGPARARSPARASPPSTRSTTCPVLEPGRDRGVGVFALLATAQGLWIGSDTERIGRYEHHGRSPSCPWPAAPRCPSPGSAPCRATCSAWAWTAP